VKTLADPDAGKVNVLSATPISIADLNAFPTHCNGLPEGRTFPEEFRVFEVVGRITFIAHEDDRDYHIAIEDLNSSESSVVAELADTVCMGAVISPHFPTLRTAEAMFETLRNERPVSMNRTGFIGGPIPREDGAHGTTQQVLPGVA